MLFFDKDLRIKIWSDGREDRFWLTQVETRGHG